MIRLTTALLTLGISMAIATTAVAQNWWVGCNPDAPMCRLQTGSDPQWAPGICRADTSRKHVHVRAATQHRYA
jgi:hypothetical protein